MLVVVHGDLPSGKRPILAAWHFVQSTEGEVVRTLPNDRNLDTGHMRLLYDLDGDFRGRALGVFCQDVRIGLEYLMLFERIAVVSNVELMRDRARVVEARLGRPVRVFAEPRLAIDWLTCLSVPEGFARLGGAMRPQLPRIVRG